MGILLMFNKPNIIRFIECTARPNFLLVFLNRELTADRALKLGLTVHVQCTGLKIMQ